MNDRLDAASVTPPSSGTRQFTPAIRRFLLATVVNMVGSAALFAFLLVYLHEVRGLALGRAGVVVGVSSLTVMVLTPWAGSLADRFGGRAVMTAGCLVSIVAGAAFAVVDDFVSALVVSALLGLGNALWWPAQSALVSVMVTPSQRPAVMAWQRAALNVGAALGGVVGGLIVRSETLGSFRVLFAVNVASYVLFLAVIPGLPHGRVGEREGAPSTGFAPVLRDRFFLRLLATDLSIALGFGYLWSFTPAYASHLGIDKATIGLLFTVGAASVALSQIPTLRWVSGGARMRWLMVMNLWFAAGSALMLATPHVTAGFAVVLIAVGQVCGGFGESVLGAVRQPLTSDLAPTALVGRYFGLAGMVFQAGMGAAPALGGLTLQWSASAVWAVPFAAAVLGTYGVHRIRHRIPAHAAISP